MPTRADASSTTPTPQPPTAQDTESRAISIGATTVALAVPSGPTTRGAADSSRQKAASQRKSRQKCRAYAAPGSRPVTTTSRSSPAATPSAGVTVTWTGDVNSIGAKASSRAGEADPTATTH